MIEYFRAGHWEPANQIERSFVRHMNSNDSSGEVWHFMPGDARITVSVIIPTLDAHRNGYFPKLLGQLERQDFRGFEVIVIRADSRQGRAINIGASLAQGRFLISLDDDTCLTDPGTFRKLVAVMEANADIGIAGGNSVIPSDASPFLRKVMQQIPRRSWEPVQTITDSDLAEHPLMIMRRDIFVEIGGENELMPRGLDPYLRQQFRKAGYRVVVVPGACYSHLPPATLSKLVKQFYRNGQQAAFCNKYFPQWVIETPPSHGTEFVEQRPFLFRLARQYLSFVKKTFQGHWIYLSVYGAYAVGFIVGILKNADTRPI
jgi:glycosyltransferase involved in cell wall biosynthesis